MGGLSLKLRNEKQKLIEKKQTTATTLVNYKLSECDGRCVQD